MRRCNRERERIFPNNVPCRDRSREQIGDTYEEGTPHIYDIHTGAAKCFNESASPRRRSSSRDYQNSFNPVANYNENSFTNGYRTERYGCEAQQGDSSPDDSLHIHLDMSEWEAKQPLEPEEDTEQQWITTTTPTGLSQIDDSCMDGAFGATIPAVLSPIPICKSGDILDDVKQEHGCSYNKSTSNCDVNLCTCHLCISQCDVKSVNLSEGCLSCSINANNSTCSDALPFEKTNTSADNNEQNTDTEVKVCKPISDIEDIKQDTWKLIPITLRTNQKAQKRNLDIPTCGALRLDEPMLVDESQQSDYNTSQIELLKGEGLNILSSWSMPNTNQDGKDYTNGIVTIDKEGEPLTDKLVDKPSLNVNCDPRLCSEQSIRQVAEIKPLRVINIPDIDGSPNGSNNSHKEIGNNENTTSNHSMFSHILSRHGRPETSLKQTVPPKSDKVLPTNHNSNAILLRSDNFRGCSEDNTKDVQDIVDNVLKANLQVIFISGNTLLDTGQSQSKSIEREIKNASEDDKMVALSSTSINKLLGLQPGQNNKPLLLPNDGGNFMAINPPIGSQVNTLRHRKPNALQKRGRIANNSGNEALSYLANIKLGERPNIGKVQEKISYVPVCIIDESHMKASSVSNERANIKPANAQASEITMPKMLNYDQINKSQTLKETDKNPNVKILNKTSEIVLVLKNMVRHLPFCLKNGMKFVVASDVEEVIFLNHDNLFGMRMAQQLNEKDLIFCNLNTQKYFSHQCQLVNSGEMLLPIEDLFTDNFLQLIWSSKKQNPASAETKAVPMLGKVGFGKKYLPMVYSNDDITKNPLMFVPASDLMAAFPVSTSCLETLALYASRIGLISHAFSMRCRTASCEEAQALMRYKAAHGYLGPKEGNWRYLTSRSILVHWDDFRKAILQKTAITRQVTEQNAPQHAVSTMLDKTSDPQAITRERLIQCVLPKISQNAINLKPSTSKANGNTSEVQEPKPDLVEKSVSTKDITLSTNAVVKQTKPKSQCIPVFQSHGMKRKVTYENEVKHIRFKISHRKKTKDTWYSPKTCKTSTPMRRMHRATTNLNTKRLPIPIKNSIFENNTISKEKEESSSNDSGGSVCKGLWVLNHELNHLNEDSANIFETVKLPKFKKSPPKLDGVNTQPEDKHVLKLKQNLEKVVSFESSLSPNQKYNELTTLSTAGSSESSCKKTLEPTVGNSDLLPRDTTRDIRNSSSNSIGNLRKAASLIDQDNVLKNPTYLDSSNGSSLQEMSSNSHMLSLISNDSIVKFLDNNSTANFGKTSTSTKQVFKTKVQRQPLVSNSPECPSSPEETKSVTNEDAFAGAQKRILEIIQKQSGPYQGNPGHEQQTEIVQYVEPYSASNDIRSSTGFPHKLYPGDTHRGIGLPRSGIVVVYAEIPVRLPYILNNGFPYTPLLYISTLFSNCRCALLKMVIRKSKVMSRKILMCSFEEAQLLYNEGRQLKLPQITSGDLFVRIDHLANNAKTLRSEIKEAHKGRTKSKGCYTELIN